jgi:hypothetical protein
VLAAYFLVALSLPRYEPLFAKLSEQGKLPELTRWLMAFSQFDTACFHLPIGLVIVAILALEEAVVRRLRRAFWSWLCVLGVTLAAIPTLSLLVIAMLMPILILASEVK